MKDTENLETKAKLLGEALSKASKMLRKYKPIVNPRKSCEFRKSALKLKTELHHLHQQFMIELYDTIEQYDPLFHTDVSPSKTDKYVKLIYDIIVSYMPPEEDLKFCADDMRKFEYQNMSEICLDLCFAIREASAWMRCIPTNMIFFELSTFCFCNKDDVEKWRKIHSCEIEIAAPKAEDDCFHSSAKESNNISYGAIYKLLETVTLLNNPKTSVSKDIIIECVAKLMGKDTSDKKVMHSIRNNIEVFSSIAKDKLELFLKNILDKIVVIETKSKGSVD